MRNRLLDGLAVTTHRSGPSSPLVVELVGMERCLLCWQRGLRAKKAPQHIRESWVGTSSILKLTATGTRDGTPSLEFRKGRAHHMRSLPEMQSGIKLLSRVQQS